MTAPRHRVEVVSRRTGTRTLLNSWPPVDRGGSSSDLGEIVEGFDWERQYRLVGAPTLDPRSDLIDIDNGRQIMRVERLSATESIGEILAFANWTGRLDDLAVTEVALRLPDNDFTGDDFTGTTESPTEVIRMPFIVGPPWPYFALATTDISPAVFYPTSLPAINQIAALEAHGTFERDGTTWYIWRRRVREVNDAFSRVEVRFGQAP